MPNIGVAQRNTSHQTLSYPNTSNGFPSIRTDNPLDNIGSSELEADVTAFHSRLSLDTVVDLRTLINGARLAKQRLRNVPSGLTPAELETITRESSDKYLSFLQTRGLLVTVMATACAAITQYVCPLRVSTWCLILTIVIGDGSNQQ